MVKGFFFNRIKAEPAGAAIGGQHYLAVDILTHKTKSPLAFDSRCTGAGKDGIADGHHRFYSNNDPGMA